MRKYSFIALVLFVSMFIINMPSYAQSENGVSDTSRVQKKTRDTKKVGLGKRLLKTVTNGVEMAADAGLLRGAGGRTLLDGAKVIGILDESAEQLDIKKAPVQMEDVEILATKISY